MNKKTGQYDKSGKEVRRCGVYKGFNCWACWYKKQCESKERGRQ